MHPIARPADHEVPAELHRLAAVVPSLMPDRRDPERFHVEKDGAAARLAALARRIERETA